MPKISVEESAWNTLLEERDSYKNRVDELVVELQTHTDERQKLEATISENSKVMEDMKKQSKLYEDLAFDKLYNPNRPVPKEKETEAPKEKTSEDFMSELNDTQIEGF